MPYYAHATDGKTKWQSVKDHLFNTAAIAARLGGEIGLADFAYLVGLLHDIGKYSQAFQRRLRGASVRVDHSTAGAVEVIKRFQSSHQQQMIASILAYCITGHHGGLLDYGSVIDLESAGTLQARLKKPLEDYSAYREDVELSNIRFPPYIPIKPIRDQVWFSLSFFTRMIYSLLVDADFIETETFMSADIKPRGEYPTIPVLLNKYDQFLESFSNPQTAIARQRTATLRLCISSASEKPGFFSLTVPTGGGKTFSSMAFALHHAAKHGLRRVIYVIPYTSIIEQNAAEFKLALGEENVLEHHSNFDWNSSDQPVEASASDVQTSTITKKLKLAAENWDVPVIVTTNVQFFESLFANRSSRCRKLHNIARSVIVFDETQMLPREYLRPCLLAVYELVKNYGASAVFCTATQPVVEAFLPEGAAPAEMAGDPTQLFEFYKRVQVRYVGEVADDDLAYQISGCQQALCIVNTRRHARGLYEKIPDEGRYHLSTWMCAAHRKEVIAEIRKCLKANLLCRVISTQIMEAGIDIDFPIGFRAMSGLDSIIQAAGRVNREGKRLKGELIVFDPLSEYVRRTPAYIQQGAEVARNILRKYADPVRLEAVRDYYQLLYDLQDPRAFDQKEILACFRKAGEAEPGFDFATVAKNFKLIQDNTVAVVIPWNESALALLQQVKESQYPLMYARELQPFTLNIYEREFQALSEKGLIDHYNEAYAVLNDMNAYDPKVGLVIPESSGGDAIFFDG